MKNKKEKIGSFRFGIFSEYIVMVFLWVQFYRIKAHRYKTKLGEIDIVAVRGKTVAIIEVKARKKLDHNEVVTSNQVRRINNATSLLIAKFPELANYNLRFDLIVIRPWKLPLHIKNAWQHM